MSIRLVFLVMQPLAFRGSLSDSYLAVTSVNASMFFVRIERTNLWTALLDRLQPPWIPSDGGILEHGFVSTESHQLP